MTTSSAAATTTHNHIITAPAATTLTIDQARIVSYQTSVTVLTSLLEDDCDDTAIRARLNKARLRLLDALDEQQLHLTASLSDRVFNA